jgi:hypothetical protein
MKKSPEFGKQWKTVRLWPFMWTKLLFFVIRPVTGWQWLNWKVFGKKQSWWFCWKFPWIEESHHEPQWRLLMSLPRFELDAVNMTQKCSHSSQRFRLNFINFFFLLREIEILLPNIRRIILIFVTITIIYIFHRLVIYLKHMVDNVRTSHEAHCVSATSPTC